MSFVERELDRIRRALPAARGLLRDQLMAAQQSLCWALEPEGYASPMKAITGTREATEGCPASNRPLPS